MVILLADYGIDENTWMLGTVSFLITSLSFLVISPGVSVPSIFLPMALTLHIHMLKYITSYLPCEVEP